MFKFISKAIAIFTLASLIVTGLALAPAKAESDSLTDEEIAADSVFTPSGNDLVEFTIDARWGFVRGNKDKNVTEKNYDGSIYAGNDSQAHLALIKTLQFERNDKITSTSSPVVWTSKIQSHWDGALVTVLAKADADIVVKARNFSITKKAKEFFGQIGPIIEKNDSGEMLAVKVNKKKHRRAGVIIWWGKKDQAANATTTVDFSGQLTMDTDAAVKLKRPLRFEVADKITSQDRTQLSWTSTIASDRDGLYTLMLPNRDSLLTSGFTIKFDNINFGWSKHFTFEDAKNGASETITVNGQDYIVVVGKKNIVRQLVKARLSKRLYLIKDNTKYEVDNNDILSVNGWTESQAIIMDDDELESYEDGDYLTYPDGTVVQNDADTYVIENGIKRRLASQEVIKKFTDAKRLAARRVSQLRLDRLSTGDDVINADEIIDGSLVKVAGDSAVWQISGNKRKVFTHIKLFDLHKLNFDRVKTITAEHLAQFSWDAPIEYPDGALVKIPTDPKVYLLSGGARHWVETEADLLALGFKFSDIVDMPPTEIINYPEGGSVVTD